MRLMRTLISAIGLTLLVVPALALEVGLAVTEDAKVARKPGTVSGGVPFAKGVVRDISRLSVSIDGKPVPAQFAKLAAWEDGSARWVLVDCQAEVQAGGKAALVMRDDGRNPAPAAPVEVTEPEDGVKLTTGTLEVLVDRKKAGLLRVKLDGKEVVGGAGRGPVLWMLGPVVKEVERRMGPEKVKVPAAYGPGRELAAGAPSEVKVEHAGSVRATVVARGKFEGVHEGLLSYTARVSVFAGQKLVKVHFWLENDGGMGYYKKETTRQGKDITTELGNMEWLSFDGMALELGVSGLETAACEGVSAQSEFKLFQTCMMNKDGRNLQSNDYDAYSLKDFGFAITGAGGKELKRGERTDGVVELSGTGGKLTTAIRDFWQQYEKGIELTGGRLRLWFWPTGGSWPRKPVKECGVMDPRLDALHKEGAQYYLPGSVHKGHEFILDFSGRSAAESSAELSRPLFPLAPAEYYAATEAAPFIFAPPEIRTGDGECDGMLEAWMRMTRSAVDPDSPHSLYAARRQATVSEVHFALDCSYWYGWMDFGDIPVLGRGPSGLDYDWTLTMLVQAMRTGNVGFLRFGSEMARHRIDVDQHWSDRDPPEVNGLQRSGGFPTFHCRRLYLMPGASGNHLAGTALYYMLTGEPKALECCRRNAQGIKAAWQDDLGGMGWSVHAYCAMYALTGERQWLKEALGLFEKDVKSRWKSFGPHLHRLEQFSDQEYQKNDIKYCYILHSLCLLHRYTGDEEVFKLLKEGCDRPFPSHNFYNAPLFLSDLYAYVALVTGKGDYADEGGERWSQASPPGKCPPVFEAGNSIWNREAGMHLRAGHILQYYFWKKGKP